MMVLFTLDYEREHYNPAGGHERSLISTDCVERP